MLLHGPLRGIDSLHCRLHQDICTIGLAHILVFAQIVGAEVASSSCCLTALNTGAT